MYYGNTKVLVGTSIIVIILGLGFLWFGLGAPDQVVPPPAPIATSSASIIVEGERVMVTEVVDGDTIKVSSGKTVRFIGIDTPETKDPRRPVGCFGKEASNETKSLLDGKVVILKKDISETDKYGRLLRYIFLPLESGQILFVNDYLVREGFAKASTYPPDVKYNDTLREAEKQAREGNKGLWGRC